jgi:hypothetical protein
MYVLACLSLLLTCAKAPSADAPVSPTVQVKYAEPNVEIDTFASKVKVYTNNASGWSKYPAELEGLKFTRHAHGRSGEVTIDAAAGATVYLIFGAGGPAESTHNQVTALGWTRLGEVKMSDGKKTGIAMAYKLVVDKPLHATISGGGGGGISVISKNLELIADSAETPAHAPDTATPAHPQTQTQAQTQIQPQTKPQPQPTNKPVDIPTDTSLVTEGASHVAFPQASIKSLEIFDTDTGLMLGKTSELVLTTTPGKQARSIEMKFVGRTGQEMNMAREEATRYIRVNYPKWYVDEAELTFEEKDVEHDGASVGAALGTLLRSVLQGFEIDSDVAITGDISANGKLRAIGGVSAKLTGAAASRCKLVVLPLENYDQLMDAVIYAGPTKATDVQVIGVSNLDEAVAAVRIDRDPKLTQAISLFTTVQQNAKKSPEYLRKKEAADVLAQVLALAPQHLSAKVLLELAQAKTPPKLSAVATRYYTFLAARNMIDALEKREGAPHNISSGVVRTGLADLNKLRPIADPSVRPLIEAWSRFLQAWNENQQGITSTRALDGRRQELLDEMAKEQSDAKLMQTMLKQGM